jgi:DNA-binding GntR family transcriptional regulator
MATPGERRLEPISTISLSELAYRSIRESIVHGRFAMGEQIVETRVAEDLGISRAPIREALRRLGEERLVVERPRYGTFVREFSAVDFVDTYNVRIAVETAAIRLVTRRQPDLRPVESTITLMSRAASRNQGEKVVDLELAVHQQLCDASGNGFLASVFRSLSGPIRIALGLDAESYRRLEDVATEHPPLLEAIRTGDEHYAAAAVQEHILASVGPVLERLGGRPQDLLRGP